jgi:hypothetical protein
LSASASAFSGVSTLARSASSRLVASSNSFFALRASSSFWRIDKGTRSTTEQAKQKGDTSNPKETGWYLFLFGFVFNQLFLLLEDFESLLV